MQLSLITRTTEQFTLIFKQTGFSCFYQRQQTDFIININAKGQVPQHKFKSGEIEVNAAKLAHWHEN